MKESDNVTIVVFVPETHADQIREALGNAGAGAIGNYTHCSFSVKGIGRFKPGAAANPFIGTPGTIESVPEERIETTCSKAQLPTILTAIKKAHPYEEPAIDIYPLYLL